jgi:Ca2+-transporting ATPase
VPDAASRGRQMVMRTDDLRKHTIRLEGLAEAEARSRLAQVGPNILHRPVSRGLLQIVRGTLREPMFLFLLVAASLYLVVGNLGEGLFLLGAAVVSIGLVVTQEARSQRALEALQVLAQPFSRVIRGGVERKVAARELVPGDIILLAEGERIPVDGVLVGGDVLTVDESTLTGESVPVTKAIADASARAVHDTRPNDHGHDEVTSFLFAGTLVVRGHGTIEAVHTGPATRLGRIGASLASIQAEPTLLQRTTARLIGKLGLIALGFCLVVLIAYGLLRGNWIEGALAGITLAIALLPEEFPMVLAVFMAMGAWRLAQQKVLVRRAAVIETLGAATMMCVDKTGTLTENRMAVAAVWVGDRLHDVKHAGEPPREAAQLIDTAALASAVRPVDPMDRAVRDLARGHSSSLQHAPGGAPVRTHPLRPGLLAVIQVWATKDNQSIVAAKGAPEAIFQLCQMNAETRTRMHHVVASMAESGLRVLGVASRRHDGELPQDLSAGTFTLEGLLGFLDPLRPDVPKALVLARQAGVAVTMITGDYPATARAIAAKAGIDIQAGVLTGAEIAGLGRSALRRKVARIRVFARVLPEQKLALVEAFKSNGEVLIMTGDGINDAPALEAAHIGIAMGERGTDVAREAADVVLLDDSFASIVSGIALGRRIFRNLRKALIYVTAVHVPIAGLALLPILLGLPPLLYPLHVVLLELVVDPVCSLVFEAEPADEDAMSRPPRAADESLFGKKEMLLGLLQGAVVLAAIFGLYAVALNADLPESTARALAFVALIVAKLVLAFADSAEPGISFFDRRRRVFWIIGAAAAVVISVVLYVPAIARMFMLSAPDPRTTAIALGVALAAAGWFGFLRRARIVSPAA